MSYRHYINVVDKVTAIRNINEVNRMAEKYRNNGGEEDIGFMDVIKTLGGTNVYELGKYSDEGYALEKSVSADIPFPLKHCFQNLHDVAEEHECGFNVISREDLVSVIESYNKIL